MKKGGNHSDLLTFTSGPYRGGIGIVILSAVALGLAISLYITKTREKSNGYMDFERGLRSAAFEELDKDGDNLLTREEFNVPGWHYMGKGRLGTNDISRILYE